MPEQHVGLHMRSRQAVSSCRVELSNIRTEARLYVRERCNSVLATASSRHEAWMRRYALCTARTMQSASRTELF